MSRVQNADWKLQGGECSWDDLVIESECSLEGAQWISESHGCLHLGEWWMHCWTESNVECSAMLNTVQCWTECNVEHRVQRSVQQIRRMFAPQWVALMACCDPQFVRQAHCQCLNQLIAQAQAQAQAHCQCLNLHHLDCQATTPMILDSSPLPSCCWQHTAIAMPVQVVPQPPNICLSSIDGQVSSAPRILQSSSCRGCQKLEASHTANSWDNIPVFDIAPE